MVKAGALWGSRKGLLPLSLVSMVRMLRTFEPAHSPSITPRAAQVLRCSPSAPSNREEPYTMLDSTQNSSLPSSPGAGRRFSMERKGEHVAAAAAAERNRAFSGTLMSSPGGCSCRTKKRPGFSASEPRSATRVPLRVAFARPPKKSWGRDCRLAGWMEYRRWSAASTTKRPRAGMCARSTTGPLCEGSCSPRAVRPCRGAGANRPLQRGGSALRKKEGVRRE